MAHDGASGKVVETQSADLRDIPDCTIAHQADRSQALEDSRHHFTAMGSVIRMPANFLQNNYRRLPWIARLPGKAR